MLELRNIGYSYMNARVKKDILKDINFKFESGKMYSILGDSGAGKTTLLSLMAALDHPMTGKIVFNGQDIEASGLENYRKKNMGMIFQDFHLVPYLTGIENVLVAMSISGVQIQIENVNTLLEGLGIDQEKANRPVQTLSGGEQQRIAIARAVACEPDLILADEPTGNLDTKNQKEIIKLLKNFAHDKNMCVIVVTHSMEVARSSDVICTLENGVLISVKSK